MTYKYLIKVKQSLSVFFLGVPHLVHILPDSQTEKYLKRHHANGYNRRICTYNDDDDDYEANKHNEWYFIKRKFIVTVCKINKSTKNILEEQYAMEFTPPQQRFPKLVENAVKIYCHYREIVDNHNHKSVLSSFSLSSEDND